MQHNSMEKNTLTTAEAAPVLLRVPRSPGPSRSQSRLAAMTAGFVVGVLTEISGEALVLISVDEKTLWPRMLLWCLANSILCLVVMEGLHDLSGKRRPKYGLMPMKVSFLCAHNITTCAVRVVISWCLVGSNKLFPLASLTTIYALIAIFCIMKPRTHEDDDDEGQKHSFIEKVSTV
jgi:hypothetical protein